MSDRRPKTVKQRLKKLEAHLSQENPVLLEIVKSFRALDKVAHGLGILKPDESYTTQVPWWPTISILGTYSSGKSTFINHYLGETLQMTGNQAVDDKFTVVCYGGDETSRTLPGLALDADTRFTFYGISSDIEEVAAGEGRRVDAYLQLKTSSSPVLKGKILIDSPGFDADAQRTSTLRITDHIIDLSDLVLVFFDARHPEAGTMQDTLDHLVGNTVTRADSNKFMYVLNQIDATAREDNPEEVFAAWQRALSQKGLTAGRFYRIYTPEASIPIENEKLRARFQAKRDADMAEISARMGQVEVERAYRIVGVLEKAAKQIETVFVPKISAAKAIWKRRVAWLDAIFLGAIVAILAFASISLGYWDGLRFAPPWLDQLLGDRLLLGGVAGVAAIVIVYLHYTLRRIAAQSVIHKIRRDPAFKDVRDQVASAFTRNTSILYSSLSTTPVGWGRQAKRRIAKVLQSAESYVQGLNDSFTDPSGDARKAAKRAATIQANASDSEEAVAQAPAETPEKTDKVAATS